ncbi:ATP-dependent DNA helicase RecQ [Selenomonas sp. KH1T6]|nr:ATP-dependent DNA helicase RecQ [Selenomonas ruminantium]
MDNPYIAEAQTLLRKYYGYPDFRPAQRPVVESLLSGADTLAIMPTGAGGRLLPYPRVPAPFHHQLLRR